MRIRALRPIGRAVLLLAASPLLFACSDDVPAGGGGEAFVPPAGCEGNPGACTDLRPWDAVTNREASDNVPVRGNHIEARLAVRFATKNQTTNQVLDPIGSTAIRWAILPGQTGTGEASLLANTSNTNGEGVAEVTLVSGIQNAQFQVEAWPNFEPKEAWPSVKFNVNVVSKDSGDIVVNVEYPGGTYENPGSPDYEVEILLFAKSKLASCAVEGFDKYKPRESLVAMQAFPAERSDTFDRDPILPATNTWIGFNTGDELTALAFLWRHYGNEKIAVAWACEADPTLTTIKGGESTTVTLNLTDLTPIYAGDYEVFSNFDFIAMLPDNIETWVRAIGKLFTNPGEQLLAWLRNVDEVDEFMGALPGGFEQAVEGVLTDLINQLIDSGPPLLQDIKNAGADIFLIGTELRVRSIMHLAAEPVAAVSDPKLLDFPSEGCDDGDMATACSQTEQWIALGFNWRNSTICEDNPGDVNCTGYREYSLQDLGVLAIQGEFNASVRDLWELSIDRHPLTLDWGALVLHIVEQILLPIVMGPSVDSIEDMIFSLLGGRECVDQGDPAVACCEAFVEAELIANLGGAAQNIARSICKRGIPAIGTQLRNQLIGQDVDTSDTFQIGTSDRFEGVPEGEGKSCTVRDEEPRDLKVDRMGKHPAARCDWRASLSVGDWDSDLLESPWHACRDRCPDGEAD